MADTKTEKRAPTAEEIQQRKDIEAQIKANAEKVKPILDSTKELQKKLKALPKPITPKKAKVSSHWVERKAKSAVSTAGKATTDADKKKDLEDVEKALRNSLDKKTFTNDDLMRVAMNGIKWAARQPEPVSKKAEPDKPAQTAK